MKLSHISIATLLVSAVVVCAARAQAPAAESQSPVSSVVAASGAAQSAGTPAEVPRLIKFGGTLLDAQERPVAGPVGVTFALYARQTGGAALWLETQNVKPDANGNYTVLLGAASANGVPAELFTSAEARWLGIQVEQEPEQARILLVSVPYALKAKDAETLGGLPASAFVTAETLTGGKATGAVVPTVASSSAAGSTAQTTSSAQNTTKNSSVQSLSATPCTVASDGTGAVNSLLKFSTDACHAMGSAISESSGQVGIGSVPTSIAKLLLNQNLTNFGTKWLQRNLLNTTVTSNGTNLALGMDTNLSSMSIPAGVTDNGYRLGVRGQSQAGAASFAGTLAAQYGVVGYAGITQGASGATVTNAYGGQFNIFNLAPGTTITNAYGVWIKNSDTGGTITNRYDLYASSPNANNFFAGKVGIGTKAPAATLDVNGNLNLPDTSSATAGIISLAGIPFLHDFPSGSQNTFLGLNAGNFTTTGQDNTAAGYVTLKNHASGNFNTAIGSFALLSDTGGSNNTALGAVAGVTLNGDNANRTGSNNTFIGYNSGPGTITQLTNATAIGANAVVSESNALVLGGTGANAVKVGIGTTTPAATLDVAGNVNANAITANSVSVTTASLGTGRFAGHSGTQILIGDVGCPTSSGGIQIGTVTNCSNFALGMDVSTGTFINRPTGQAMHFKEGNGPSDQMIIASGGNVGIGTTAPAFTLDVNGRGNFGGDVFIGGNVGLGTTNLFARLDAEDSSGPGGIGILGVSSPSGCAGMRAIFGHLVIGGACGEGLHVILNSAGGSGSLNAGLVVENDVGGTLIVAGNPNTVFRVDNNGTGVFHGSGTNINIGDVSCGGTTAGIGIGSVNCGTFALGMDGSSNGTFLNRPSGGALHFKEGNGATDQMIIVTGGNVGIGTQAPDNLLTVNGSADKPGGGSWGTFSDGRLKNMFGSFRSGLKEVLQLNPIRYRYKEENPLGIHDSKEHIGLVAQEVEKVIPEAVSADNKGYLLVNNDPIIWSMLNAIKEQQRQIEIQTRQIRAQRKQLQVQATELAKLKVLIEARAESQATGAALGRP